MAEASVIALKDIMRTTPSMEKEQASASPVDTENKSVSSSKGKGSRHSKNTAKKNKDEALGKTGMTRLSSGSTNFITTSSSTAIVGNDGNNSVKWINLCRRESHKRDIDPRLCFSTIPFTDQLYGDNVIKDIKDIQEAATRHSVRIDTLTTEPKALEGLLTEAPQIEDVSTDTKDQDLMVIITLMSQVLLDANISYHEEYLNHR
ncbi:hypothetical protein LOTGIDRAFT_162885 [Lottia gigantea]|uniref:Uncharacterized protein n=1 Tax=Lottia gigantea TaxID=225164 RepID=V4AAV1_LOTGI|nr:hypothetical protein LOTGIDRAFT_162885 [Lottia gigantea]ESO92230.1 hypothetical protein LOTGIDRAFT_162885 [Lottia gigantea]